MVGEDEEPARKRTRSVCPAKILWIYVRFGCGGLIAQRLVRRFAFATEARTWVLRGPAKDPILYQAFVKATKSNSPDTGVRQSSPTFCGSSSICGVDGRWLHYPCHGWPNRTPEHQIQVSRTQIKRHTGRRIAAKGKLRPVLFTHHTNCRTG